MDKKTFYVTTPIYYPSGKFHIGTAYTTVFANTMKKYKEKRGYDTYFLTGSDEHGQKIGTLAQEKNQTPQEYVDGMAEYAKGLWKKMKIENDDFIRTTEERHVKAVQKIFEYFLEKGDIYKGEYEGWYCMPCETYFTKTQLVDGKCPDCGREVKLVTEEAYFFKLSKYQDKLIKLYEEQPDFILPVSRKNELVNNFIKPGLEDLCVSRTSVKWGIPVDFDPKHVIYVWIDALTNYITSLGYPDENSELFKKYWPADLHLVGKEITRFHAIIWPALLWALDLPLPKQIFGHGWLIINGGKISKSLGNYKDPREYIDAYGVDAVRYFALREVSFGSDGNFSEEALINRTNTDLVNNLGNLVNRTISMAYKYFDGHVENPQTGEDIDKDLIENVISLKTKVNEKMDSLKVNEALEEIFNVLSKCNKYIDDTTPWLLAKDEAKIDRLKTVIYNILESIRICAILLEPFINLTSDKILNQLNTSKRDIESIETFGNLETGIVLNKPEILFNRIEVK